MTAHTGSPSQRTPGWRRGLSWLGDTLASLIWLASALLALLLASLVAIGLWATTPTALPQALGWAQQSLKDPDTGVSPLQFQGARGSLFNGGYVERLTWQASGWTVDVQGMTVQWSPERLLRLAFQRSLTLDRWEIEALTLTDERPSQTSPVPLQAPPDLRLPWLATIDLPLNLSVFTWTGDSAVRAGPLQARYRYEVQTGHRLDIDSLHWQEGVYTVQAQVATNQPLEMRLHLQGLVQTPDVADLPAQRLIVAASATGSLGGAEARMDLEASIQPADASTSAANGPRLSLVAAIQPWADMPVERAAATLQNINVAQFWPPGPVTRLAGQWQAGPPPSPDASGLWQLKGHLTNQLPGAWDQRGLPLERLDAHLQLASGQLIVQELTARLGRGQLQAEGTVKQTVQGPEAHGSLRLTQVHLQDLWSTLPHAAWNADLQTHPEGTTTRWQARAAPVGTREWPSLAGSGRWDGQVLDIDDLQLDWLGSRLTGRARTALDDFKTSAADLTWTTPGASMRLQGAWPLTATGANLQVDAHELERFQRWSREALRTLETLLPASNLHTLGGPAWQAMDLHGQATWAVQVTAESTQLQWQSSVQADVDIIEPDARWHAQGEAHMRGQRMTSRGTAEDIVQLETMKFQGGGQHHPLQWQVELSDALEIRRTTDGPVQVGAGQLRMQPVHARTPAPTTQTPLSMTPADVAWGPATWHQGHLETSGRASHIALSWLNAWLSTPEQPQGPLVAAGIQGDLWLEARWDLSLPLNAPPTGAAPRVPRADWQIQHQHGDLSVTGRVGTQSRTIASGIESLALSGRLSADELVAELMLATTELGQAQAQIQTRLTPPSHETGWAWPQAAPLAGHASMQWKQMDLLAPFLPPGWRVEGTLSGQARLTGTRDAPNLVGQVHLQELAVRSLVDGIDLSSGELLARIQGQQIVIERLHLQGAGGADGGTLTGQGQIGWNTQAAQGWQPELDLVFTADSWRVLARADRRLILSGSIRARLSDALLDLSGRFQTQQALFLLPDEATPALGRDVVIRGGSMPVPLHAQLPFQTRLNVLLDLGNQFEVRGLGLQTTLEGVLQIEASPGQLTPSLTGDVRTVRGTYRAYGQSLEIERGLIRFNGPYDNPVLDILAVRPHPTQKVGVEISGSAQAPRVRLYADPDLPDNEKLAWLILGRPASGAGAQAALLQQAALALLGGQGGRRDGSLAQVLGLDELAFRGQELGPDGTTTAAVVTLGKRISEQLYVSFARSVTGTTGTVAMFLDLSRFLTLRVQAGADNAVDLIFTREFDRWLGAVPRTIAQPPP